MNYQWSYSIQDHFCESSFLKYDLDLFNKIDECCTFIGMAMYCFLAQSSFGHSKFCDWRYLMSSDLLSIAITISWLRKPHMYSTCLPSPGILLHYVFLDSVSAILYVKSCIVLQQCIIIWFLMLSLEIWSEWCYQPTENWIAINMKLACLGNGACHPVHLSLGAHKLESRCQER